MLRAALCVACATLALAGCGAQSSREDSASDFAVQSALRIFQQRFAENWGTLHPALRRVTTRAFYLRCQRQRFRVLDGADVKELRALGEHAATISVPGIGRVPAVAVRLEVTFTLPGFGRQHAENTAQVVRLGGRWRGTWTADVYAAYRAHRCPA